MTLIVPDNVWLSEGVLIVTTGGVTSTIAGLSGLKDKSCVRMRTSTLVLASRPMTLRTWVPEVRFTKTLDEVLPSR